MTTKQVKITHGEGIRLYTENGEVYHDAVAGTFNVALGYSHPDVVNAITDQVKKLAHLSSHHSKPLANAVISKLLQHAPKEFSRGWLRDITGSTANECAIKIAQKATGKTDVISFFLSHHGQTNFMTAVSGNAFRRKSFPDSESSHSLKVPAPYCHRCFYKAKYPTCGFACVERIKDFIEYSSNGRVAAFIVEPILANGGNIVPPPGYFEALTGFCRENAITLIADEVHTGIGRCGSMFAGSIMGLEPDIITLAKGIGGIGIPSAAVLMKPEYDVLESYEHSFTSGGNLLALVAAETTLDVIERDKLIDHVRELEPVIRSELEAIKSNVPGIGDVRGMGFMWGIELEKRDGSPDVDRTNHAIEHAFNEENLILRSTRYGFGNVIEFRPSITASKDDLLELTKWLRKTLEKVALGS